MIPGKQRCLYPTIANWTTALVRCSPYVLGLAITSRDALSKYVRSFMFSRVTVTLSGRLQTQFCPLAPASAPLATVPLLAGFHIWNVQPMPLLGAPSSTIYSRHLVPQVAPPPGMLTHRRGQLLSTPHLTALESRE